MSRSTRACRVPSCSRPSAFVTAASACARRSARRAYSTSTNSCSCRNSAFDNSTPGHVLCLHKLSEYCEITGIQNHPIYLEQSLGRQSARGFLVAPRSRSHGTRRAHRCPRVEHRSRGWFAAWCGSRFCTRWRRRGARLGGVRRLVPGGPRALRNIRPSRFRESSSRVTFTMVRPVRARRGRGGDGRCEPPALSGTRRGGTVEATSRTRPTSPRAPDGTRRTRPGFASTRAVQLGKTNGVRTVPATPDGRDPDVAIGGDSRAVFVDPRAGAVGRINRPAPPGTFLQDIRLGHMATGAGVVRHL